VGDVGKLDHSWWQGVGWFLFDWKGWVTDGLGLEWFVTAVSMIEVQSGEWVWFAFGWHFGMDLEERVLVARVC